MISERDILHIKKIHKSMGINEEYFKRGIPMYSEANTLIKLNNDIDERSLYLTIVAANAWILMKAIAESENIILKAYSGFRNYEYQRRLVEKRMEKGEPLEEVLRHLAAPGFSEHHTGCAIDITTDGCRAGSEDFAATEAFKWLSNNSSRFGFAMSFPKNNSYGLMYEPWHWCYQE